MGKGIAYFSRAGILKKLRVSLGGESRAGSHERADDTWSRRLEMSQPRDEAPVWS
jgi:hypothetical protein